MNSDGPSHCLEDLEIAMFRKTSLALAVTAGALLIGTPAYAGDNLGLVNELQVVPCLSNFGGVSIDVPVGNATSCPKVR